jgi:hypothetical protein
LLKGRHDRAGREARPGGEEGRREAMKLGRCMLVAMTMAVLCGAGAGCKSSSDQDSADPQPGVQSPTDPGAPTRGDDRRARRHHHRHGHGEWRMRRAQAQTDADAG